MIRFEHDRNDPVYNVENAPLYVPLEDIVNKGIYMVLIDGETGDRRVLNFHSGRLCLLTNHKLLIFKSTKIKVIIES